MTNKRTPQDAADSPPVALDASLQDSGGEASVAITPPLPGGGSWQWSGAAWEKLVNDESAASAAKKE